MSLLGTITDVVAAYREYLATCNVTNASASPLKRFDRLFRSNEDSAHAEAATFDFLDQCHLRPRPLEDPSTGGPDFECSYGSLSFAVEVTSIGDVTLTKRSGMKSEPQVAFVDLPELVRGFDSRVSFKNSKQQARQYAGPRALTIVTKHIVTPALFAAGMEGFVSSVFCRKENGVFVPFRRAYGLVLLLQITGDASFIVGALHPEPEHQVPIDAFPRVPFARIATWPPSNGHVAVEWVIARPYALKSLYLPAAFRKIGTSDGPAA